MNNLFYYFAFPHYRLEILKELNAQSDGTALFTAGTESKANIKVLTAEDIPFLHELKTTKLGPFTWQHGIFRRALTKEFDNVVLGPATTSLTTLAIVIGRRIMGRPTFLWGQNGRLGEHTPKRYIQEILNRLVTGLLVYGEAEAAAAGELGTPARKVHIVNNATHRNDNFTDKESSIDAFQRLQKRIKEASESGKVTLSYVGRLTHDKKIDVLLSAARQLHHKYPNLRVNIIGGGDAETLLKEEFTEPYFHFLGWVYDNKSLNAIIEESTLMVSPFHQGLMAVDALRIGVPVLIPDNPLNGSEVEALTENINSLRFTPGSSQSLSAAVDRWFEIAPTISEDDYKRARIEALKRWSPEGVAQKILKVIDGPHA